MATISEEQKTVKVERVFEGLQAFETNDKMTIVYKELTFIDNELIKEETKSYDRDCQFWKASELGQAILGMVALDLAQEDPSAPRI
jgi:hypothetical protein